MAADSQHLKMSILPLLRARSLDEPGAGIPHAGISEVVVGKPALLAVGHGRPLNIQQNDVRRR